MKARISSPTRLAKYSSYDVVPKHGREEADQRHRPDAEPARAGVDGRDDQHGLARHRHAEVLEKDQAERQVAEAVERRFEAVEDAGQMRRSGGGAEERVE